MYVIIRDFKLVKSNLETFLENYNKPFPLQQFEGFIKREVLSDTKDPNFDLVQVRVYFKDRNAYYAWESSDIHKAMHKEKGNKAIDPAIIEVKKSTLQLVTTQLYEKSTQ